MLHAVYATWSDRERKVTILFEIFENGIRLGHLQQSRVHGEQAETILLRCILVPKTLLKVCTFEKLDIQSHEAIIMRCKNG